MTDALDLSALPSTSPRAMGRQVDAIRASKATSKATPLEKVLADSGSMGAIMGAQQAGKSVNDQLASGHAGRQFVLNNMAMAVRQANTVVPDLTVRGVSDVAVSIEKQQVKDAERKENISLIDQVVAANAEFTLDRAMFRTYERMSQSFAPDPSFDPLEDRDVYEQGLQEEDRQWLRDVHSAEERLWKLGQIRERQANEEIMGAHGAGWAVATSLVGGLGDVSGLAVSLGIGKVAHLAGVGSRAAWVARQRTKAVGFAATEGAIGNVLFDAALDASGSHVTYADYVASAAFGAVLGQANLIGKTRAPDTESVSTAGMRTPHAETVDVPEEVLVQAVRKEAGEMGTPELTRKYEVNPQAKSKGQTKGAVEVLEELVMDADPTVSHMARRLHELWGDDVPVKIRAVDDKSTRGIFDPSTRTIFLNAGEDSWVKLHEIAHAASFERLRYGRENPSSVIGQLTKQIDDMHAMAVRESAGKNLSENARYFLTNQDEFISGLYSGQSDFHEFLKGIKVVEDNSTLLNKLVRTLRRVLGLGESDHNAFTKLVGLSDNLFQEPLRVRVMKHKKGADGKYKFTGMVSEDQTPQYRELTEKEILDDLNDQATREIDTVAQEIQGKADKDNFDLYSEAQKRAGEEATADEIAKAADNIAREQVHDSIRFGLAEVPDSQRVLPRWDGSGIDPETGQLKPVADMLRPKEIREEVGGRNGITEKTVEDPATRAFMQEIAAWAEDFNRKNPVDQKRLKSLFARVPWLATTGLRMARSRNPVARAFAGTALEVTTGAMGRRRTAAITKAMRERLYMAHLGEYENVYKAYRNKNGGSWWSDVRGNTMRQEFDRQVDLHRQNRALGVQDNVHPHISSAADVLDAGYNSMRKDQQHVGTIGSDRLGDNSIGYAPRHISKQWIAGASESQIEALVTTFQRQLEKEWSDFEGGAKFARDTAVRYVERARSQAYGSTPVPAHVASNETASILRDILRTDGIPEADVERLLGRFSRGGAGHTKKRLDLDLTEEVTAADGSVFRIAEAFETDQARLYQNYARRVSGEVALTMHGIPGEQGLRMIRKTMEYGPRKASKDDMDAFDQTVAEFLGRPFGDRNAPFLDNLRLLTGASRLGAMAMTQMAEFANGAAALGTRSVLNVVKDLPRLIADVHNNRPSEILRSIELIGGELGTDHKVIFPYQEPDDIRVFGRDSLNAFDRVVRGGANALPWLSGWHHLHAAQVRGISEQIVHKAMRYIREGGEDVALAGMGIDADIAARLKGDLDRIATFDSKGRLTALDLTKATDDDAVAAFVQGVHRGSKQIIQGSYIGETGKWAHDGLLRILTQFRTFSLTAMEKQWTRQRSDYGTIKAFGILMGQMSFALPIHYARMQANALGRDDREEYLERNLTLAMMARATLNYASISGAAGDILDGGAMLMGLEGTGVRTGYGASILDSVPAAGYVNQTVKGITSFAPYGDGEADPRQMVRALPGGNLPWLMPVLNIALE